MFFRNDDTNLPDYTISSPRTQQYEFFTAKLKIHNPRLDSRT